MKESPWTQFMDMHSGGGQKLDWQYIYIEAPEAEAKIIFQNRFGRSPDRVTCTCCGEDYSASESPTLEEATQYERGCRWVEDERGWKVARAAGNERAGFYIEAGEPIPDGYKASYLSSYREEKAKSLDAYIAQPAILVIRAADIKPEERVGEVRSEGYVWQD